MLIIYHFHPNFGSWRVNRYIYCGFKAQGFFVIFEVKSGMIGNSIMKCEVLIKRNYTVLQFI